MGPLSELEFLLCLFLTGAMCWFVASLVLRPLKKRQLSIYLPVRYSLLDLVCLMVAISLSLGFTTAVTPRQEWGFFLACNVIAVLLTLLIWWVGLRSLSRAGVFAPVKRAVGLIGVIPLAFVETLGIPYCLLLILIKWLQMRHYAPYAKGLPELNGEQYWLFGFCLALGPLCWLSRWMLSGAVDSVADTPQPLES